MSRLEEVLSLAPGQLGTHTHHGSKYIILSGTGECSVSPGVACWVYDADDVYEWLAAYTPIDGYSAYQDMCDETSPSTDREIAYELAREGYRVLAPGACDPVLSDAEYAVARADEVAS